MTSFQYLLLLVPGCLIISCKALDKKVIGKYVSDDAKDTLKLNTDNSYTYIEKLNSGNFGLTEGKWKLKRHKIRFICDHQPLVGYQLKIRKDSNGNNFQLKFIIGDTKNPVEIKTVSIFKNSELLKDNKLKLSKNNVRFLTTDFDSIAVKANNFQLITFPVTLNKSQGYIARVYPKERFYELDKVVFRAEKLNLNSIKTKRNNSFSLSFVKIGKD